MLPFQNQSIRNQSVFNNLDSNVDILVIGRSISGFSVAMSLLSANKRVAIVDYLETLSVRGTSIIFPTEVNHKPIMGDEFEELAMQRLTKQKNYLNLGETTWVESVHFQEEGFLIYCNDNITVLTNQIVFAPNGRVSGWEHLPNIEKFYGLGVTQDAWSDASFTQGSHVVIAGCGDRVLDQANWVAEFTLKMTLICPKRTFSFSNQHQEYFSFIKGFKAYKNCSIQGFVGEENTTKSLAGLKLKQQNIEFELACSYLFLADPITVSWKIIGGQEEIRKWITLKKLFVTGIANKVSYSDHKALYLDGKRCAYALLKS